MPDITVELDRVATGGAAIGRAPDGRVAFVTGGLPNEAVTARVTGEHRRRVEADIVAVDRAADGRRAAPCPRVADGCGGCDWQHATPDLQSDLRRIIVDDCLRRLAHIDGVDIRPGPSLDPVGYRTTVRVAVSDGRPGYRAGGSHRVVTIGDEGCLIAHPLVDEVLVDGRFGPEVTEVTVRAGARTGERLVIVSPRVDAVRMPDGVVVVGADELAAGRAVHYHEEVGDRRLRISATAFFQCRPDGAEALANLVDDALGDAPGPLLDAYCGVGLFGALVAGDRPVVAVESNRAAVADAAHNLGSAATVVRARLERWRPSPAGVVVADPARSGLGPESARRLAATGAEIVALVSCDPAAMARDVGLLVGHGYDLDRVTVLDLFGQTSHVETVSRLVRRR
ncbi:MAG: class I SAM-dependent RNA methyltransferase [Acidimicrobiales bacterium]